VRTMNWPWFRMILDRNEVMPYGVHLQTFFALLAERPRAMWQRQG